MRHYYFARLDETAPAASGNTNATKGGAGEEKVTIARVTVEPAEGDPDIYCVVTSVAQARNPPPRY